MKYRNGLLFTTIALLVGELASADDGTLVFQSGDVAYVFPWKLCLVVSAALTAGFYFLRK